MFRRALRSLLMVGLLSSLSVPGQAQTGALIRYVKAGGSGSGDGTSWANASADVQTMINAAGVQQVWVATGRYVSSAANGSFRLKNNVAIYGGFRGSESSLSQRPALNPVLGQLSSTTLTTNAVTSVILSDGIAIDANSADGLTPSAQLDGVVITGGQGFTRESSGTGGGGIHLGILSVGTKAGPQFRNLLITNNSAFQGGGVYNAGLSLSFVDCVISGNRASYYGGGVFDSDSRVVSQEGGNVTPSYTNCIIRDNSCENVGGGIAAYRSLGRFRNCQIINNEAYQSGGGVFNYGDGGEASAARSARSASYTNCLISDNRTYVLAQAVLNCGNNEATFINCLIKETDPSSFAFDAGLIYNSTNARPQFLNCTLVIDLVMNYPCMINGNYDPVNELPQGQPSYPTLINCILINPNNPASDDLIRNESGSTTANYCLIGAGELNYTGTGNQRASSSPFRSATDYSLRPNTQGYNPAIDGGDLASYQNYIAFGDATKYSPVTPPATDLAGAVRVQGRRIDAGAYELAPDLVPLLYARPTSVYGPTSFSVVVELSELNGVGVSGPTTLRITKDSRLSLSLDVGLSRVGSRPVQNSQWQLDSSDPVYYILRTSQAFLPADRRAVGLTGTLSPRATSGQLAVSGLVVTALGESSLLNNADSDKIDYFQQ